MSIFKKYWFSFALGIALLLGGGKAVVDHLIQRELTQRLAAMDSHTHITYASASLTLTGALVITDVQVQHTDMPPIEIESLRLAQAYQFYSSQHLPSEINVRLRGFKLRLPETQVPPPEALQVLGYAEYFVDFQDLHRLGYAAVQADAHLQVTTPADADATTAKLTVQAGGWGNLTVQADLQAVPPPVQWAKQWRQLKMARMAGTYQQAGLFERALSLLAQRHQTSAVALQRRLSTQLQKDLRLIGADTVLIAQVQAFIETLTVLQIDYAFSPPLSLSRL